MSARGSCRAFQDKAVPVDLVDVLCATALAAPTKSDLQQRDIILLQSQSVRQRLADLVGDQAWVADAPMIAVFCGNNRRQRLLHEWHDIPFANDHFDAVFNSVGDAAIALGAFVTAAEAVGLGCCPISAVRNEAGAVSKLLNLPDHVIPFAGLAFGFPEHSAKISRRHPMRITCHIDSYQETDLKGDIARYDAQREKEAPYQKHRLPEKFGEVSAYGWSEDKVRQYSEAERSDFGMYLRACGFRMD